MKNAKLLGVPALLLVMVTGWLVYEGLRVKNRLNNEYALPADQSPRSLLEFMRKLDGSIELTQGLVKTNNVEVTSQAVLKASELIRARAHELSDNEQREVSYFRIRYTAGGVMHGYIPGTEQVIAGLVAEVNEFLLNANNFGSLEQQMAEATIAALEATGRHDEELSFVTRLSQHLSADDASLQSQSFVARLERFAFRLKLTNSQIELQSSQLNGDPFDLRSHRGKIVLLEFWGTRCQPCIADFPALNRIYNTYGRRGFEIVAVCLNAEPERIRRFAGEHDLPWIQLCDNVAASVDCNASLSNRFGIELVPTTFLIDSHGTVIAQGIRPLHEDPEKDLEKQLMLLLP